MKNVLKKLFKIYNEKKNYSIGLSHFVKISPNYSQYKNLNNLDYKVYSQNGEDGILDYFLNCLNIDKPKFVEIGIGDYSECNSRFIFERTSPKGLVIDCIENLKKKVSRNAKLWKGDLKIINEKINSNNIIEILNNNSFLDELDLFSLDIDSTDYWVLKKMPNNFSKIAIIEYNSVFGPDLKITVPNIDNFNRNEYHFSNLCFGASLRAIIDLMEEKNFKFVGTNLARCNAFFILEKYLDKINVEIPNKNNLSNHTDSNIRESRDQSGKLNYISGDERIKSIYECDIIDLNDNKIKKIKSFFETT